MKSQYAIFSKFGDFVRFEQIDPEAVPAIPLADDGLPRAVPVGEAQACPASKLLVFSRAGWSLIDRDTAEVAAAELTKKEREEARAAIEEMVTIAQTPITTVAQASVAIRKTARAVRWLLRNELS